jgi:hypothetical protein
LLIVLVLAATLFPLGVVNAASYDPKAKLLASDGDLSDIFGSAVSVSGDTIVVGADWDSEIATQAGAAYVFERNQGGANQWGEVKKLTAFDGSTLDLFGAAVCIGGDTIVVGAPFNDAPGTDSGSAYVFERDQGGADNWGLVTKLIASDGAAYDYFGYALSISGDTIAAGAFCDDDNGTDSGSAYVFERNQGGLDNWAQVKKLTASDGAAYDYFGRAASISGDTIVVGAYWDDDKGTSSGSAYLFARNQGGADNWGETKKLTASDGATGDLFGYAVSISGDTIVVGSYEEDDKGTDSGSAYVLERNQGGADNWGEVKKLTASDGAGGDSFGVAVSVSDDTIVVGAYLDDDKGTDSGSTYVFERDQDGTDNWGQVKKLTASDGADSDYFGVVVSISGGTIVVGAPYDDDKGTDSGSAYVFQISSPEEPPSVPASVPGVSFWGNVALAVLIAGAMVWSVRRRRVSVEAR